MKAQGHRDRNVLLVTDRNDQAALANELRRIIIIESCGAANARACIDPRSNPPVMMFFPARFRRSVLMSPFSMSNPSIVSASNKHIYFSFFGHKKTHRSGLVESEFLKMTYI